MKLLLELSMECESLARAEAMAASSALGGRPKVRLEEPGIIVIDAAVDPKALASRLGLCHFVSEWLGTCAHSELEATAKGLDAPGPIRVRSTKVGEISVDLAGATRTVGAALGKSRGVDLHTPKSDVRVVYSQTVSFGRVLASIDRSAFEKRKNRYMPFFYPASLHPKFARAIVNLTCVKQGGKLLDPFCGTGAIPTEASLAGLEAIGSDLSEKMIDGSRRNLKHVGASAELHVCDVGDIAEVVGRVDGIATDPPYGKSTSTEGEKISALYQRAFGVFGEVLNKKSRVAIVVPSLSLISEAEGFKLVESHELRVHRSLTRNFCVLENT